ncbi:MAG TPA: hypothetical protein VGZ22_11065 [Isosphaeraceae bacterium]|nr:hypothetical protein [Isosphaeraceae bacterium]
MFWPTHSVGTRNLSTGPAPSPLTDVLRGAVVVAVALVAVGHGGQAARGQASALAQLETTRFDFNLTSDEAVTVGPPVLVSLPIGNATLGRAGVTGNFGIDTRRGPFDPNDPGKMYELTIFAGPVTASSPPPPFSLAYQQATGFLNFENFSPNAARVTFSYSGFYDLLTQGMFSLASLELTAAVFGGSNPDPNGIDPNQPQPLHIIDVRMNGDSIQKPFGSPPTFDVVLPGAGPDGSPSLTSLRVNALVLAEASSLPLPPPPQVGIRLPFVPEPPAAVLLGIGILGLAGVSRFRSRVR